MLNKLAIATFKHRFKDFLVLFMGLVISVAIFLMFSNIANNYKFIKENISQSMIVPIFVMGQFLLAFVIFIYLNFANNFLRELREREYGLLMMMGANPKKIANLLMKETVLIGFTSMIFGLLLGTYLTAIFSTFLQNLLHVHFQKFKIINFQGFFVTLIFFVILYIFNGLANRFVIKKTDLSQLLSKKDKADIININIKILVIKTVAGLLMFSLGFFLMLQVVKIGFIIFSIALILNIIGTYYIINSSIVFALQYLKKTNYIQKGLRLFIIGQLTFRIQSLSRILTIVSILFALAYGALATGLNFQKLLPQLADKNSEYSLIINNPDTYEDKYIAKLKNVEYLNRYYYTTDGNTTIWENSEFLKHGLPSRNTEGKNVTYSFRNIKTKEEAITSLNNISSTFNPKYISQKNIFSNSKLVNHKQIVLIKVKNLEENDSVLSKLVQLSNSGVGSYTFLVIARSGFGALEFIGFFLSIAFLSMLASTLMFKVLRNVGTDIRRYNVLNKLGTKHKSMKWSVTIEIGTVFLIPALIGGIDVAIGLNLLKTIISNPYLAFPQASVIIYAFYLFYYILTSMIYWKALKQGK